MSDQEDRKSDPFAVFPQTEVLGDYAFTSGGMSLRDWFAGQALASGQFPHNPLDHGLCAEWSYHRADAMLEARK